MRGRLFRKYVTATAAIVCLALITNGLIDIWFSYREQRALLMRIQQSQADFAAADISQYFHEIETQMAWITSLPWNPDNLEQWRLDAVRLMRHAPAITELTELDSQGREQFRMSRQTRDVIASETDHSADPAFVEAMARKFYYGPVYYVAGSEPYMTLALAGTRREDGVIVAQVNLKFIWDVVSRIKVGDCGAAHCGVAYVVDSQSRLIAHPDISLVLRNTDLSHLPQVQNARLDLDGGDAPRGGTAIDLHHKPVLSAYAAVPALNWLVFVDLPLDQAYAPIYVSVDRSGALLLAALALSLTVGVFLARRMTVPIRALNEGAARIGSGDLTQRIAIDTRDELQELGEQFNNMAARLEESYATLEGKVEQRTRELEVANNAKSRFLAAASHDLRQPLHALGLFVGQLRGRLRVKERERIIGRIEAAVAAMSELFHALLDISKLDAGAMAKNLTGFPVAKLLGRVETTFAEAARAKGLSFRVVHSSAWVRSDFILLEQIVFNLVSNAIRYTQRGGLVVGCRSRQGLLRVEVADTGSGIPPDQQDKVFGEFYRLAEPEGERRAGLGLGLAIVDRLCRLLDHPIGLKSVVGKGSVFSVDVPLSEAHQKASAEPALQPDRSRPPAKKLVVVIDDDPLVLEGMSGIFRSWGCKVITAESEIAALSRLTQADHRPDLIISDYHLAQGRSGFDVVEKLRNTFAVEIPAFLISGDTNPKPLHDAKAKGFHLLHKPVDPIALRAMFNHTIRQHGGGLSH
ncbi:MAG TPA: ATP-binding protein [Xanthobacteraceae bacterium]|nr:ATP-binding protein [Xanthobacteraceae bacterium]